MAKVLTVHLAGKKAYLMTGDPDNLLSRRHAKAIRKMLKRYLKLYR